MAAIWFFLLLYATFSAVQARTWRASFAWMAAASVFMALFQHASPLVRELLG